MKLLIAGSRGITDFDLAPYIPDGTDTIISGGVVSKEQKTCIFYGARFLKLIVYIRNL